VAWPFGYGLSYTTFDYSNLEVPAEVKTSDESLHIAFEVANTGKMDADEIAQVYLSPTQENQNIRPIQLQGFARISLKAGERKKVKVKLYTEQFGYYSNNGKRQWNIAPGTFTVKIGASSQDIKLQKNITVKGDIVVKTLRDFYFSEVIK
jgi:beta-glucosidase